MRFVDDVSGAGVGLSRVVDVIFSFQTLVRQLGGDFVVMTSCSWSVYILTTVLNVYRFTFEFLEYHCYVDYYLPKTTRKKSNGKPFGTGVYTFYHLVITFSPRGRSFSSYILSGNLTSILSSLTNVHPSVQRV